MDGHWTEEVEREAWFPLGKTRAIPFGNGLGLIEAYVTQQDPELAIIKQKNVAFVRVSIRWSFCKWYIADLIFTKVKYVCRMSTYVCT